MYSANMSPPLRIKLLDPEAKLPKRSTLYSAAYDLYALETGLIYPRDKSVVPTGIAIRIPTLPPPFKVYARIASRSGLSAKFNLETGAGVIDADYDQEIRVILHNHSDKIYMYEKHDRIAQLILEVIITPEVEEVLEFEELNSDRTGGFGSTGF